ncbi:MAG: DUF2294 family protein [Deltaproteobacteria bacterium]|nr:DUF2294 family protein [Deltaproteobacteria bacterium]
MENPSHFDEQQEAIAHFAGIFLEQKFGFPPQSIKVLMEHDLVVIRVNNFLSPAEIEMGNEKMNTNIIHDMYSKLFNKVKSSLVDQIKQITSKKVISSQIGINFETKVFMMTFFLFSTSIEKE